MNRLLFLLASLSLAACGGGSANDPVGGGDTGADTASSDVEPDEGDASDVASDSLVQPEPVSLRVATFNVSLYRDASGELIGELRDGSEQGNTVAEIIQIVAPDILVLNEFDYDSAGEALDIFCDQYLAVSQNGHGALDYPYRMAFPSNTGIHSGFDLDNDGNVVSQVGANGYGNDAFGFGQHPGQYAFAIASRYPIDQDSIRSFQEFLWQDMPDALLPEDPGNGEGFYSSEELAVFRLSSKNHVDVPVLVGEGQTLHMLLSHPTPAGFDGAEDRNGRRNADEIRLWADYVDPARSFYLTDDDGRSGGLAEGDHFIVLGDLNDDPFEGNSAGEGIRQLLEHPLINVELTPASEGGAEQAELQGQVNERHEGDPAHDTADFSDGQFGNQRVDYVLPSTSMTLSDAGVFWPASSEAEFDLVGTFPFPSSDHRMVWIDVTVP